MHRLHFWDVLLHLRYRGPNEITCGARFKRGTAMGWFEHGSTIIVLLGAMTATKPSATLTTTNIGLCFFAFSLYIWSQLKIRMTRPIVQKAAVPPIA
jgi:hypothetical protein